MSRVILSGGKISPRTSMWFVLVVCAVAGQPMRPVTLASVPNPIVIGPIPATATPGDPSHDYPFFSTPIDLASVGYIEEEYFFEGMANRYSISDPLETATIYDSGHPYRTRMVVRRPISPDAFNGTVLLEWQNNAFLYDIDGLWAMSADHLVRRGYAWVGVSAFQQGVHDPSRGLRAWNPVRYGTLDVTDGGTLVNNELSFDIISQAAMAVKSPVGPVDPMGGLSVERVFGMGASQSSNEGFVPYHNSIHPLADVFDAFFSIIGAQGRLRTDLDVKVFRLWTESEVWRTSEENRQEDSDHLRRWEVAGASHFDWHIREALGPVQQRDLGVGGGTPKCELPPFSRIPFYYVVSAAIDRMVEWMAHGTAPSSAPDIEVISYSDPDPVTGRRRNVLARDSFGNVLGGIRLSQHAVPTATNTGVNGPETLAGCRTYGSFDAFDQATLDTLYTNHGEYVNQVARATADNLKAGYIVMEDASATVGDAAESMLGKP